MGDEKIIAIPFGDPTYNQYRDVSELPDHLFREMRHFFAVYKALENKTTAVKEVGGHEEAVRVISDAIERYRNTFPEKDK